MEHKLDNIDRKIIEMLQKNARTPVKEIAKEVFLSSPAVSARIEHLERADHRLPRPDQPSISRLSYKSIHQPGSRTQPKKRLLSLHPVHPKRHRMQLRHRRLLHAHRSSLPLHHGTGPLHQRTPAVRPHQNTDRILHQRRTQRSAGGVNHIPRPASRQRSASASYRDKAFPPSYPAQRIAHPPPGRKLILGSSAALIIAFPADHSTQHLHPNSRVKTSPTQLVGWQSALFFKSPLSERLQDASSDFWKTVLAEFRQPRSQPPTKPRRQAAHASRASVFQQKKNSNEPQIHHCSSLMS